MDKPLPRWGSSLLTTENAKTTKGEPLGILTGILYLAPSKESVPFGGKDMCPSASKGCAAVCLFNAGFGRFKSVQAARIAKTVFFATRFGEFMDDLRLSIKFIADSAAKQGLRPAVRLNGTSDVAWEKISNIMTEFPDIQFYDYTKLWRRAVDFGKGLLPTNYYLTFSRSEENQEHVAAVLDYPAVNIAAVWAKGQRPDSYFGRPVIDGDLHDVRFLDPTGVVVGLTPKGALAKKDTSGFVIRTPKLANEMVDKMAVPDMMSLETSERTS